MLQLLRWQLLGASDEPRRGAELAERRENDSKTRKRRRAAFLPSASLQTNKNASYRRLAFYTDSHPPMINNIFDNKLCQAPEGISCAVVDSTVCFFLEEGLKKR